MATKLTLQQGNELVGVFTITLDVPLQAQRNAESDHGDEKEELFRNISPLYRLRATHQRTM